MTDFVSLRQFAAMLWPDVPDETRYQRAHRWLRSGKLPEPDFKLEPNGTNVWAKERAERWVTMQR